MQKRPKTEQVLEELGKIRAMMPLHRIKQRALKPKRSASERIRARSMEEFELQALAEALEQMADDAHAISEGIMADLIEKSLDVYYTTEELSRDPEHAHLIEHVEKIRTSYQKDFGRPIPTKEETEQRRAREKLNADLNPSPLPTS
jgi:hypothetical protein